MFRKTAIVFSHMAMNNKAALRIPDIPYPIDYIIKGKVSGTNHE